MSLTKQEIESFLNKSLTIKYDISNFDNNIYYIFLMNSITLVVIVNRKNVGHPFLMSYHKIEKKKWNKTCKNLNNLYFKIKLISFKVF